MGKVVCVNCGKQIHQVPWFTEWCHEDGMLGCRGMSGFYGILRSYEKATPLTPEIALKALYACIIKEDV